MNWDRIEGNWKQFKGRVKSKWGELTDDELDMIEGDRDVLLGKLQQRYGIARDEAEKEVAAFERELQ
ncbi:MAG: CsbD family protein [Gammaproteobacteria bacterium]|nr:CsbD family protein [Gammaproteobacteria bacterium]